MTNPSRGELIPGGLAMIISDTETPIANGRVVTLVSFGEYKVIGEPELFTGWECYSPWLAEFAGTGRVAIIAAKNLMPIKPEPDPLGITQQQEQSA